MRPTIAVLVAALAMPVAARAEVCDFIEAINRDDLDTPRDESVHAVKALFDAGCALSQAEADELLRVEAAADAVGVARLLILRGKANVNARDEEDRTSLHRVVDTQWVSDSPGCEEQPTPDECWVRSVKGARFLLSRGADPNLQDRFGLTPLHAVIAERDTRLARVLLAARPDVRLADNLGITLLHLAAREENPELARVLLARGADPNAQNVQGQTPLHIATMGSYEDEGRRAPELVRLLLARGARPTLTDEEGKTALHVAASNGKHEVARVLLAAGTPVEALDHVGATPLHDAAYGGDGAMVALLLRRGANAGRADEHGRTPLHWFARFPHGLYPSYPEDLSIVRRLLASGADIEARDAGGRTPLFYATLQRNRASVNELIARGASLDARAHGDVSLLHLAAYLSEFGTVGLLLDRGAAVDPRDAHQRTPLHYAALLGSQKSVERLLQGGADPNAKEEHGSTPLALAEAACQREASAALRLYGGTSAGPLRQAVCWTPAPVQRRPDDRIVEVAKSGNVPRLAEILEAGAVVDERDATGRTSLHWVAEWVARESQVELLLKYKADVRAVDDSGQTPLHVAAFRNHPGTAQLLLGAGALVNARDANGSTPLHLVHDASQYWIPLVMLLVQANADLGARDRLGRTPLHTMCDVTAESPRMVAEYLICNGADPSARDALGWTASEIALVRGWADPNVTQCTASWQKHAPGADTGPDTLGY